MKTPFYMASIAAVCSAFVASPSNAEEAEFAPLNVQQSSSVDYRAGLDQFTPRPESAETKIDYSHWDEALKYFVFRMGRSAREGAPTVSPEMGTRRVFGHASRLRLEGNRVGFSFLEDEQITALTAYRQDLENTAKLANISALPKNEQLAFWINLHNVAIIEQIALAYPLQQPSRMQIGPDKLPLDQAKIVTVSGIALSPHDIRTKIVFPNWRDPRVIYGFFRGEIGGPTIQKKAFNGENVGELLDESAFEFVNSLRGTEKRGKTLHVSKLYEEAAPFYFKDLNQDLRQHIKKFSTDEVGQMIDRTTQIRATLYERDVSDLAGGERSPVYSNTTSNYDPRGTGLASRNRAPPTGVPANIGRLVSEKENKMRKLRRSGALEGRVIVLDPAKRAEQEEANKEIE